MTDRDDIERELTQKDKQALISYCLKLYDTNVALTEKFSLCRKTQRILESKIDTLRQTVVSLKKRKWYNMIFKGRLK